MVLREPAKSTRWRTTGWPRSPVSILSAMTANLGRTTRGYGSADRSAAPTTRHLPGPQLADPPGRRCPGRAARRMGQRPPYLGVDVLARIHVSDTRPEVHPRPACRSAHSQQKNHPPAAGHHDTGLDRASRLGARLSMFRAAGKVACRAVGRRTPPRRLAQFKSLRRYRKPG